jgi:hypothetical protein
MPKHSFDSISINGFRALKNLRLDGLGAINILVGEDLEELLKPAGRHKAIVGSIASILRPGKAIQVSLQDNRWLRDAALDLPRLSAVKSFLASLFEFS